MSAVLLRLASCANPYYSQCCTLLRRDLSTTSYLGKNFYELLGVPRTATQAQIKAAYYEKAKHLHPDASKEDDATAFHELSRAYETLNDPDSKIEYDKSLSGKGFGSFYGTGFSEGSSSDYEWHRRPGTINKETYGDKPFERKQQPIDMNHIKYVYKTLNQVDQPERPPFYPFAEHNYPNTEYNRFLYNRFWDPEKKIWVYVKKEPRQRYKYDVEMAIKHRDLRLLMSVATVGIFVIYLVTHNVELFPRNRSHYPDEEYLLKLPEDIIELRQNPK